jgi:hypothetical protein
MAWRLHLKNENYREPPQTCRDYVSRTAALQTAQNLIIRPSLRKTPVLIEGPDGERMEQGAIETWCRGHSGRALPVIARSQ